MAPSLLLLSIIALTCGFLTTLLKGLLTMTVCAFFGRLVAGCMVDNEGDSSSDLCRLIASAADFVTSASAGGFESCCLARIFLAHSRDDFSFLDNALLGLAPCRSTMRSAARRCAKALREGVLCRWESADTLEEPDIEFDDFSSVWGGADEKPDIGVADSSFAQGGTWETFLSPEGREEADF
ncbi:hypothetical protein FF38_02815 [Lucilia cuprina]|uniref:Uncharacterized protein n=1 Tax=Lucilia cuprina TaxID=7375 RepID=A0A0L0CPL3_LUCCU|nr:hypothetical protein FF38_02815 [Lucilia cuprina]